MREHSVSATTTETITVQTFSDEAVARYRTEGYLHVQNVLTEEEVGEFLADAREQLDRANDNAYWDHPDGGKVMDWVVEPERKSELMRRLALHPGITGIAERLAGRPLRMFKSELLRKRRTGGAPTPLHLDEPAFPIGGAPVTLTAWVALVDVPVERGCLTFIPGSHHWPDGEEPTFDDPFERRPGLRWRPRVTVPLRAGDCTFHHARLIHLAGTNETDVDRISLTSVYMDADAVFRPRQGSGYQDHVPDLEPGQPLNTDRYPRVGIEV
ncbi:phytanoyl-CoA dioxygenase family protein [Nocardia transvalensis]|uniref:phytanoyl-CoA dioxygenase family protein n=1 Tax=Nocardia transvalensis TaxID=37333 RepID=UPI0018933DF2|nr:phytanoyl-CoA dioxygenase family protein [Nocardia transvalensis]MBF6328479.1 phytanoyl-CoA dioxygenase family protein [Nocardia transvalensis]